MSRTATFLLCAVLIGGCVGFAGCARKGKPMAAKFPADQTAAAQAGQARDSGLGEERESQFDEGELPIRQTRTERGLLFSEARKELETIYFDYDSALIKPEARAKLERAAVWLKDHPESRVQIEGYCDERGTFEYNIALGEKRALSARRYLAGLGISSDRIFTISFGEEKPAVNGHDESAWQYNRRAEFKASL